jgi:P27 family predicted phage terminase small subunit
MPTPRKTDAMHQLTGTKSQALPEPEFQVPASRPRMPKDLPENAAGVFKRLCAVLRKRRALTSGDAEMLRLYALLYVRHAKALTKLEEEGEITEYTRLDSSGNAHTIEKPNLWLKVAETAEKNMVAILDRLGLTPHNRGKVKPTPPAKPVNKPVDPFEAFMTGRASTIDDRPVAVLPAYFDTPEINPAHAPDMTGD